MINKTKCYNQFIYCNIKIITKCEYSLNNLIIIIIIIIYVLWVFER